MIRNPFKNPVLRREFDALVRMYETRHRNLFHEGRPYRGNSAAGAFWRGYEGTPIGGGFTDRASRQILMYAHYRAGQLVRKEVDSGSDPGL